MTNPEVKEKWSGRVSTLTIGPAREEGELHRLQEVGGRMPVRVH